MASSSTSDAKQIKVLVRCRPILEHERSHSTDSIYLEKESGLIRLNTRQGNTKEFTFDNVFDGASTQELVYEKGEFSRTVEAVVKGFNSTVFAYGQTGTGKTFTMEGKQDIQKRKEGAGEGPSKSSDVGVIPRIIHELFDRAKKKHGDEVKFSCSFVQIYMEQSYDLLQADMGRLRSARNNRPSSSRKPALSSRLKLRWCKEKEFYLENMSVFDCETPDDMLHRFARGVGNRKIASHRLNMQSSRSHSIFMVNVDMPSEAAPGDRIKSSLMLVDLAGSERVGHTGSNSKKELLRESVFINQSLFALRKVITNLASKRRHVHIPFRDSTLTSLLKNSLGGNAFTTMVACLTPSDTFYEENLCTLEYASRASSIVNQMTVREDPKTKLIRELKQRVKVLEAELVRYKSGLVPAAVTAGHSANALPQQPVVASTPAAASVPSSSATDYEEMAVETQNVNEALMVENADLREQLRFIQAIVTMEDGEGGAEASSSKKDLHTVETAILMELFELRRENEAMRETIQRLEFGSTSHKRHQGGTRRMKKQTSHGKVGRSSQKKGMLTVEQLRSMFSVGGSSNNVMDSLGTSMRVTTTGNILDAGSYEEEDDESARPANVEANGMDPVEQLSELLAERSALMEGNTR
ncbi:kinesin [Chloropicon primus]|uniref:Kinesin-like protein n=1 Tax=Chloropicon primus TaxID=1764295 RepID=A0A5B8MI51_9CHLO|nr:kinesin [Chloropicon primus]UPQ98544.1 kinesin [Chloropicon primus]|mmetsp:Transcript_4560/g.13559  ORF Transcript_4560/g.13559 Transcript_4560/m.13559 type:complete len:639 (+) Transcript_4560:2997-4913(+)|eukprot:QDZ19335.1 kinesin [Chloropicon primus]